MATATQIHSQLTFEPVVDERESFVPFMPEQVWIDRAIADHPETFRILTRLPSETTTDIVEQLQSFRHCSDMAAAKKQLLFTKRRGAAIKKTEPPSKSLLGREAYEIHQLEGTPLDCSYCPLQLTSLHRATPSLAVDLEALFSEIAMASEQHAHERLHLILGEQGDGLVLEPLTDQASLLSALAASKQNLLLEIFTRSAGLSNLPQISHRRHTVLTWFLNRPSLIDAEERGTATFEQRLAAARHAATAGFPIGFSFAPTVILCDEDICEYEAAIDRLFAEIRPQEIAWVTLGFHRYARELVDVALRRFPQSRIFMGEAIPQHQLMVAPRFARERVYQRLWTKLAAFLPPQKLFLMDETAEVWQKFDPLVIDQPTLQQRWRIAINEI